MAMTSLVGSGMELVVGRHAGQSQEGLVVCREMPEHFLSVWEYELLPKCEVMTLTLDHTVY